MRKAFRVSRGERKTNAAAFLSQQIGIRAIQAAAEAAAAAQTTSVVSNLGQVTDSVTGGAGPYVLGKTVAGGSDAIAAWLLERQSQSFDAVFVAAGTALAIHVDRELPIDFEPQGRKLNHARSTTSPLTTLVWISTALAGCAGTKEAVLPQDGPSMQAIYDAHVEAMSAADPLVVRAARA